MVGRARLSKFTPVQLVLLDRRSTENMLEFYEEEMRRVAEGENPLSFMTRPLIKRFVDLGIFELATVNSKRKIILSQKGRERYNLT